MPTEPTIAKPTEPIATPQAESTDELPIINCHTHIFTSDSVPPLLAKTFVPWPVYWILHIEWMIRLVKWYYNSPKSPYKWPYQRWHKRLQKMLYRIRIAGVRSRFWGTVKFLMGILILASMFHELYGRYIRDWMIGREMNTSTPDKINKWLEEAGILIITGSWVLKLILLILLLTFFPSGRNLLFFILKKFSKFFGMLPGKQTTELARRYLNIVRFARYKDQFRIFSRLRAQYPPESAMVVLPMDMEFMEAGEPRIKYEVQMQELAAIKKNHPDVIHPFIFVDPRRTTVGNQPFFEYDIREGKVVLRPCFIKTYIEEHQFAGFKIYPALGYYPFDEKLLPLWKYAADNNIPVLTHCIRGTIYYRGKKKKVWDQHPVFSQYEGSEDQPLNKEFIKPLALPQMKAVDVQEIFTHPLNYACLVKKDWLSKLVAQATDDRIRDLFGYNEQEGTISRGLDNLKICFGHFGGDDEWVKHHERDRDNWAHMLTSKPDRGIEFISKDRKVTTRQIEEQLWKYADWYSIICSLMLQHETIFADISYILHSDANILPLLKKTMHNEKLKKQVLFGTDFYVVRNHKADKQMLSDMMGGLSTADFDQMARINPRRFLNL